MGGKDHAWGADAALGSALFEEALLDGMELLVKYEAFDGGDLVAFGLQDGDETGVDQLTVDQDGECGACAVLMNGDLVNSCLIPVLQAEGAEITTIEGLSIDEKLHPIQQCFLEQGGAQCGICTPGMILATHHLLERHPQPSLLQIQEGLNGNLCRCTGYMRIFNAVRAAALTGAAE